jgi:tight adherence protein B
MTKSLTKYKFLKLNSFFKNISEKFAKRFELYLSAKKLFLIALIGSFIFGSIVYLFSQRFLVSLIFSLFGIFIVIPVNDYFKNKKRRLIEGQILEFLSLLNITLRSGLTIRNSIKICSEKIKPPLGDELKRLMNEISLDIDLLNAFHNMARRLKIPEINLIISAIKIVIKVGGNVTEIFNSLTNIIRERQNLREEIRILTTQGRFSGNIISLLPLGYLLLFYVFESEQVRLIFSKSLGVTIVSIGLILNLIGYLVIRSLTEYKVKNSKYKDSQVKNFINKNIGLFKRKDTKGINIESINIKEVNKNGSNLKGLNTIVVNRIFKKSKLFTKFLKSKNIRKFIFFDKEFYRNFSEDILEKVILVKLLSILLAITISVIFCKFTKSFILSSIILSIIFFFIPDFYLRIKISKKGKLIDQDLPNIIDELNLSCKAGLNLRRSLYLVVENSTGLLGEELKNLVRNLKLGKPKQKAFDELINKTESSELKSFVSALINGERFGVPISEILENQAKDCRFSIHKKEEQRARKIPILILFPLIFLILPGFLTIAVGTFIFSILNI